jgi:beta-lactamase superfamily II metal-dependent hydrolase
VASPLAAATYTLLHFTVEVARTLASWGGALPASVSSPLAISVYYCGLAAAALPMLHRRHFAQRGALPARGREFAFTGVLGASLLTMALFRSSTGADSSITWLGSGNAVLVQSDGMAALIDGSSRPFQLLEALGSTLPFTRHAIALVVVTDPRAGNTGALDAVLAHYRVGEVLDVGVEYPDSSYARWRADLRARGVPVMALRTGATARVGAVTLTALGPDGVSPDPRNSIGLLRLTTAGTSILLAGSSSAREQLEAVFRPVKLGSQILVAPVHVQSDFLRAANPRLVLSPRPPASPIRWLRLPGNGSLELLKLLRSTQISAPSATQ